MAQKTLAVNAGINILVWPSNPRRSFLLVQNQSTDDLLINVEAFPKTSNGYIIAPGDEWSPVNPPKGAIRATGIVATGSSQKFYTIEETAP